jgi:hypothetical protein
VVGGIQTDMVVELHHSAARRDGFVERIIPLVPNVTPAKWQTATVSRERYGDIAALFCDLDFLPEAETTADAEHAVGVAIPISSEAMELWEAWYNDNTDLIAAANGLAAGFYSKLPAQVARFSLILHTLWTPDQIGYPLSVERMEGAIAIGEFVRAHIRRFLVLLNAAAPVGSAGTEARILRILRMSASHLHEAEAVWMNTSDILDRLRDVPATERDKALTKLWEAGLVERRINKTRTKPAEQWRLAPQTACGHSVNSEN